MCIPSLEQGSHWSRLNRQFVTHNNAAQTITTDVRPADIPIFAADPSGDWAAARFVLWSDAQQAAWVVGAAENAPVRLSRGESDLITVVPLTELKGLCIAPIGASSLARFKHCNIHTHITVSCILCVRECCHAC